MPRSLVYAASLFLTCAAIAPAQMTVDDVHIAGNSRIDSAAIVAFTGLHPCGSATDQKLRSICQKLVDSGFFTQANYSYAPVRGGDGFRYSVKFEIAEDPTVTTAELDIEAVEDATLWKQLAAVNPLIAPQMPDNDLAQSAYQKALEAVLSTPGRPFHSDVRREADLPTHSMMVVFRDADRPKVTALQFEGNKGVDTAALEHALVGVVIGEPYSERDLTRIVALNLSRVYARAGYLRAKFPKIARVNPGAPEAIARVAIDEGPCWKLGTVEFAGTDVPEAEMRKAGAFKTGEVANWDYITASLEQARRVLTDQGFLNASAEPERVFRDNNTTVDLHVAVIKGTRYTFGDLVLDGLDPDHQDLVSRRFALKPGAPLNDSYARGFASEIPPLAGRRVKSLKFSYVPHPGAATNVLDVKYEVL